MDPTRWDTGQVLAAGVLNRPAPTFGEPQDRERQRWNVYDDTRESFIALVEDEANVVDCSEYYGIPVAWKDGEGYRGILFQYRSVTEDKTFDSVDELADWFVDTAHAVAG